MLNRSNVKLNTHLVVRGEATLKRSFHILSMKTREIIFQQKRCGVGQLLSAMCSFLKSCSRNDKQQNYHLFQLAAVPGLKICNVEIYIL